ncbi:phage RecT family recombinase [Elusimicrobium posterum]
MRSGYYKRINVIAIKKGELVSIDYLNETVKINFIEDDAAREKAETTHYFAMFEYMNGFTKMLIWSKTKMEAHALQYSKGYAAKKGYTFWEKDFDGMAFKTMLRQLISKWGIMSIEMQRAFEEDSPEESGKPVYEAEFTMDAQTTQTLADADAIPASRAAAAPDASEDVPPNFFG